MNAYEELLNGLNWVFRNKSSYQVSKDLGISNRTINRYQNDTTPIENMTMATAERIYNYYLKEMEKMEKTMWEFEKYLVHDEGDVLRVENNDGEIIGYVANHEGNLAEELNNGADPIADGWEDGVGNSLDIWGWGEYYPQTLEEAYDRIKTQYGTNKVTYLEGADDLDEDRINGFEKKYGVSIEKMNYPVILLDENENEGYVVDEISDALNTSEAFYE